MYQICNDNNTMDIIYLSGLVDITSNSKEFSFGENDIDCMIESLDDWAIRNMDMSNQSGYLVFNTYV